LRGVEGRSTTRSACSWPSARWALSLYKDAQVEYLQLILKSHYLMNFKVMGYINHQILEWLKATVLVN
jgi:hypothetical protein